MFKNMIRKSLALGSGLALIATGLVAAPAQAVATGLLWSAYGATNDLVGVNSASITLRIGNPTGTAGYDAVNDELDEEAAIVTTQLAAAGQAAKTITAAADVVGDGLAENGFTLTITAPVATETYVYEVYVLYEDGSQSETERVTFKPATAVSATGSLPAVAVADDAVTVSIGLSGINTANYLNSNGADITVSLAQTDEDAVEEDVIADEWTYSAVTDTYSNEFAIAAVAAEDTLTVTAAIGLDEINAAFDEDADAFELERVVSAADAYDGLDISVSTSTGVVHNSTAAATDFVGAETVLALEGTTKMNFVITAYETIADLDPAGSGHEITVTLTDVDNGLDSTTITAGGKSLSKDTAGNTISFSLTTNSSGQVAFTVTADEGADGESFTIDAIGTLGDEIATTTVEWAEAAWTVMPAVTDNFKIAPKGSLTVDYTVMDQFGNLAGTDYQLAFTRAAGAGDRDTAAEYANWSYVAPVSSVGRASLTIVDNGAAVEGSDTVTVTLQKAATAGGAYLNVAGATNDTFTITYENDVAALTSTAKVNYNGIATAAGTAVDPMIIETATLVNYDSRTGGARPVLWDAANFDADGEFIDADGVVAEADLDTLLRVYGTVVTANNAPVSGVSVVISGSGMNFADDAAVADMTRASNDSMVVFTDATGSYEAWVRSSNAGRQTISVNAQGATSSVEVRFQESTGVAATMTISAPSTLVPGARADVVATVLDKFGKPVSGLTVNFKDNGPGVLNEASAVTDIFGEAQVTLTTTAAESGNNTVTAFATIGGVTVVKTASITVGATAAAAADAKVNAGSFKGYVALYAKGYAGQRMSAKVGKDWVVVPVLASNFERVVEFTGAGYTISVPIYINRVLVDTITVTTK